MDVESLQCRLTCKSSDLRDDDGNFNQEGKDDHYNYVAEEQEKSKKNEKAAQDKNKPSKLFDRVEKSTTDFVEIKILKVKSFII